MTELSKNSAEKWYFKKTVIVLAFLTVGPLALPLVWLHPRYPIWLKVMISLGAAVFTYFLIQWTQQAFQTYSAYYQELEQLIKQLH